MQTTLISLLNSNSYYFTNIVLWNCLELLKSPRCKIWHEMLEAQIVERSQEVSNEIPNRTPQKILGANSSANNKSTSWSRNVMKQLMK